MLQVLYIGETERSFETRLKEHLVEIRLGLTSLPVASHFCSPGHYMQVLKAQILWRVNVDIVNRKHLEAWLNFRLNTVTPFGLTSSTTRLYCMFYWASVFFVHWSRYPSRGFLLFALSVGASGLGTGIAGLLGAHLIAFARQVC